MMADVRVVVRQHFPVVVAGPAGRTSRIAETISEDIALRRRTSRKLRQPEYVERALAEDVLPLVRHDLDREAVAAAAMEIRAYGSAACADLRLAHGGVRVLVLVDTFACPVVFRRAAAPPPCNPPMMMMPSGAPAPPPCKPPMMMVTMPRGAPAPPPPPCKLPMTIMMLSGAPAPSPPPCTSQKTMTTPSEVDAFLKSLLYVIKTGDADPCTDLMDKLPTDDEEHVQGCPPVQGPPGGVAEQRRAEEVLVREEDCRPVRGPSPCRWRRCFKGRLLVVVERGSRSCTTFLCISLYESW
jgi:hypothetical protein